MTAIALLRLPCLFLNDTTSDVSAEGTASIAKEWVPACAEKHPSPCTKGLGGTTDKMDSRLRRKCPSEAPLAWEESARGHWTNMQNTLGYNNILGLGGMTDPRWALASAGTTDGDAVFLPVALPSH